MARPIKDGMDYFPHDVDASNDEKIEALRALHGNDGYAFYFILLERTFRTGNAELDISKPAILAALIKKIGVSRESFNEILETALDLGCFDREQYDEKSVLTSSGIKRRFAEVQSMRERWRKNKEKKSSRQENHEDIPGENPGENAEETGESKEKKSIIKDHDHNNHNAPAQVEANRPESRELISVFEHEFGRALSPFEVEQIQQWETEHENQLVLEALKRSILRGKYNFKYINSILIEWSKNHILTIQDIQAYDEQFMARKERKGGQARAPDRKRNKPVDDWDEEKFYTTRPDP